MSQFYNFREHLVRRDGGETMFCAFADADIAASAGAAGQKPVLSADRRPLRGGTWAEQRQRRHAQPGGKMQRPGVAGDKRLGALKHGKIQSEIRNWFQNRRGGMPAF